MFMKIEYGKFMYLVAYHLYACVTRNYVIVVHIPKKGWNVTLKKKQII